MLLRVQLDYESKPKEREVRLIGSERYVGDPVRVSLGGAEIEGEIVAVEGPIVHVQLRTAVGAKSERDHQAQLLDGVKPRMAKATTGRTATRKKGQVG